MRHRVISDVDDRSNHSMAKSSNASIRCVLAIDPGRAKCGVAVVAPDGTVHYRAILANSEIASFIPQLTERYQPQAFIMGDGTGTAEIRKAIESAAPDIPIAIVDERYTSEAARARYVAEVPARGLARLLPRALRSPDIAYDDYVAVILAERWWQVHPADG